MERDAYYEAFDLPFYRKHLAAALPPIVLDFHAHSWCREHWREIPWDVNAPGGGYVTTQVHYPLDEMLSQGALLFPDRRYQAVCFGQPTPAVEHLACDNYLAENATADCFPLLLAGMGERNKEALRRRVLAGGFYGYKVILDWCGNDYGHIRIPDMLTEEAMALADEMQLVVLLHVPGGERLASPQTQQDVRELSRRHPGAQIVLAHCGRCYLPDEMWRAVDCLRDLQNVYLDTAMVMDTDVLEILFQNLDSRRILFATDLPVAIMRGRRVSVGTHWVDLVRDEGYPPAAYRVPSRDANATFMVYEIVRAILLAGRLVGLADEAVSHVFYQNGRTVLDRVQVPHRRER